jgi:hypothetical protein
MRPYSTFAISLIALLPLAASSAREFSGNASANPHAVRAGETKLSIEVIGIDEPARVAMLQRWVEEAARATVSPSGQFPLREARVQVRETDSRDSSPVPWGQTSRRDDVSVLLYVRRDATFEQLRADWTAVHEFSHLAHPYLGERGRWLAEGLASYQQNVLRARAGLLAPEETWRRLDAGFRRGERVGSGPSMEELSRSRGGTMRVYWAGAAYWLEMDLALRRDHDMTLDAVLDRYAQCCLEGTAHEAPEDFAAALDRAGDVDLFARSYRDYATSTEFPSLTESYRALGIERDGEGLRFLDDRDEARALREAMTMHMSRK